MKRTLWLWLGLSCSLPGPAVAQVQRDTTPTDTTTVAPAGDTEEYSVPWRLSYFPYLTGGANDGPVLATRVRYWQPAEYEARTTSTASATLDAGITGRGSRFVTAVFRAPGLWKKWRLGAIASADRQARYGYYGIGNNTTFDKDLVDDAHPFLYRLRRTRYRGAADVTRIVRGPFMVAFRVDLEQVRFTSLPGSSRFTDDVPSGELEENDAAGRLALVYDTRDNEYNTHQGVLLEAGTQVGSGGPGNGYTRQYGIFRGWLQVREGTVVAARVAASGMGGNPTLNARFTLPAWENTVPVLGGEYSHRSFDTGRFSGKGTLFGNLEVRHDLLSLGDLGGITLIAFTDVGRVFETERFRFTTTDMKAGGGGGFALRILRSGILEFNFAGGPDGFNYSIGSGWTF